MGKPAYIKQTSKFVTTKEVFTLRKDIKGLVIGQTDKNLNELWCMCPCLYDQAWDKAYGEDAGYEQIYIKKFKTRAKHGNFADPTCKEKPETEGGEKDLIEYWKRLYKQKHWDRYAPFQKTYGKSNFNMPYVLLKAKNLTTETRKDKWAKARPIAPQTKHPMRM